MRATRWCVLLTVSLLFSAIAGTSYAVVMVEYERAKALEKSIAESPQEWENYVELAKIYARWSPIPCEKIAELYEQAVKVKKDEPKIYLEFPPLFSRCGDKEKALKLARKAAKLFPKDSRAQVQLARFLMQIPDKTKKAEKLLRKVLKDQPDNAEAHYLLGKASLETGDPQAAVEHLKRVQALASSGVFEVKYDVRSALNRAEEINGFQKSCEAGTADWLTYNKLAFYYDKSGCFGKAEEVLRQAAANTEQPSVAYRELGRLYTQHGEYDEALEAFQKAFQSIYADKGNEEKKKEESRIYHAMGDTYREMGKWADALSAYNESEKLSGSSSRSFRKKKATVYTKLGKHAEAAPEYEAAGDAIESARAYRASKNYEKAVKVLWKKIGKESKKPKARSGEVKEAVDKDGKPIEGLLYTVRPELYIELGKTYQEMGQNGKAVMAYWEALQLDPSSEEASKAIEELSIGKRPSQP